MREDGSQFPQRVAVYIDGFNLYYGMKESGLKPYFWLDVVKMSNGLLRHGQVLASVNYFSANLAGGRKSDPPHDRAYKEGKLSRQRAYLNALLSKGGLNIKLGRYQSIPKNCRHCGRTYSRYEEKHTDVNIATSMMKGAYLREYDCAFLISGDSDLTSAVRAIRELWPQVRVIAQFPPNRQCSDLKEACTGFSHIQAGLIRRSQLPDVVAGKKGRRYERPHEWTAESAEKEKAKKDAARAAALKAVALKQPAEPILPSQAESMLHGCPCCPQAEQ